jgi:hypothetical protein
MAGTGVVAGLAGVFGVFKEPMAPAIIHSAADAMVGANGLCGSGLAQWWGRGFIRWDDNGWKDNGNRQRPPLIV